MGPISCSAESLLPQQVAHEEQQVETICAQIRQCKDQVLRWSQLQQIQSMLLSPTCMHAVLVYPCNEALLQYKIGLNASLSPLQDFYPKSLWSHYKPKKLHSACSLVEPITPAVLCRLSKQELTWVESMPQSKQFAIIPSMPIRCRAGLIEPYSITTHSSHATRLCSQRFRSSGIHVNLALLIHHGPRLCHLHSTDMHDIGMSSLS